MKSSTDTVQAAIAAALTDRMQRGEPVAHPGATSAALVDALRHDPAVLHALNAEPWYRSRVTLGALLSMLAPVVGLFGVELSSASQEALIALAIALGGVVGPALTLYGRWIATRPLGR